MARISEQTIEKIRFSADIYDVVSGYVELKKKGRNFFGLCPFHNEKTSSFSVNQEKQIFKCFGCGKGGSSIDFIMQKENLEFVEALRFLAEQYGIEIETSEKERKNKDLASEILEIHKIATEIYQKNLETDDGGKIKGYFIDRGITIEQISKFKLGYSLNSYDQILKTMQGKFSSNAMNESGLFLSTKKGYMDRFRNRIMFSIDNTYGKVVGFGGRATSNEEDAKYMNSPDTPIYHKSTILYGLSETKDIISELNSVIIVEGYMDLLQLYSNGIKNVVAISGTALTEQQIKLISRFTKNCCLAYDGDKAGISAAIRAGYLMIKNGLNPKIVEMPDGKDPDDWVKENGKEPFLSACDKALDLINFHYKNCNTNRDEESVDIARFINDSLSELSNVEDKVMVELSIKKLSEVTDISKDSIDYNMANIMSKKNKYSNAKSNENIPEATGNINLENDLLMLCLSKDKDIRQYILENMSSEWIVGDSTKRIFSEIALHLSSELGAEPTVVMDQLKNQDDHSRIASLVFEIDKIEPTKEMAIACINRLKHNFLNTKLEKLREELKENELSFNDTDSTLKEISEVQAEINEIRTKK